MMTSHAETVRKYTEIIRAHAIEHYNFGWDTIIEATEQREIEGFVLDFIYSDKPEAKLIDAAAEHFNMPCVFVDKTQYTVSTQDVDGVSVKSFTSLDKAISYWEDIVGYPYKGQKTKISDFGVTVSLIVPAENG